MAEFKTNIKKGTSGEILVYGQYIEGNEPVFVERIVIAEMDANGNVVGTSSHHVHRSIDPSSGVYLLVSKKPFGTHIKAARATSYYIEIEETAPSETIQL